MSSGRMAAKASCEAPSVKTLALAPRSFITLLLLAAMLAGSVVAARMAFDSGTSVYTALAVRSAVTACVLLMLCRSRHVRATPSGRQGLMLGVIGLMLGLQGICLYSAVQLLSVGLAVLTFNTYPLWIGLACWLLYRQRPGRKILLAMPVVLIGLALALDVPAGTAALGASDAWARQKLGVLLALVAAALYAMALTLTQHEVFELDGRFRSASTLLVVSAVALSAIGIGGEATWPGSTSGWWGLAGLTVLYGSAITMLFTVLPKLGVAGNSPIMSIEPVMAMMLAAWILGQQVNSQQVLGALAVVGVVMLLGLRKA
ncbi:DMT family transporter [Variovorax sp. J22R133]|uniref:DMT family transporter n=1 Tax=Variovorax brevis TaxID=3053503 RepID=UPI002578D2A3|nr:DMT family transporter [Variovorax sp. J22R133]MDM0116633.1 DMT family transporter [Variovorax sp. J22R133]